MKKHKRVEKAMTLDRESDGSQNNLSESPSYRDTVEIHWTCGLGSPSPKC